MRARRPRPASLSVTQLEDRTVPAAWVNAGPFTATNGQVEGIIGSNPVSGAIQAVAPHPTNPNVLFVGSVNGGVWETTNAQAANPNWTPLTDTATSLSISDIEFDPTDGSHKTIVASIGRFSSFSFLGGPLTGLLRTTDGGTTWLPVGAADLAGRNISAVEERGNTILAAANDTGTGPGLYRSTDGGASFTLISGTGALPSGAVFDLAADPTNRNRIYAAVKGAGVYRTDDAGATWSNAATDSALSAAFTDPDNDNARMAAANNGRLYIGVLVGGAPTYIGYTGNLGSSWTQMDLPVTRESDNTTPGVSPEAEEGGSEAGGQGEIHFAIAADPTNANIVYVSGDRQPDPFPNAVGANDYSGRAFRGDTTVAPVAPGSATNAFSPQWASLTNAQDQGFTFNSGTANNTSPHADSRSMKFDAAGRLIQGNDGGVYVRTSPRSNTGDWFSLMGTGATALAVTEAHDVAYDSVSHTVLTGNQDTGTTFQPATGSLVWDSFTTGDGGDVAVDTVSNPGFSIRYSSYQGLGAFSAATYSPAGNLLFTTYPSLVVSGTGGGTIYTVDTPAFTSQLALNAVNPRHGLVATYYGIYESLDQYNTLTDVTAGTGLITAMAYGGRAGGAANPDVIYYADSDYFTGAPTLFLRTAAGGPFAKLSSYPGSEVRDIALNPRDWHVVVVVDSTDHVWRSMDAGTTWADISGNVPVKDLYTVAYISGQLGDTIVVGGSVGVAGTPASAAGSWVPFGTGLPNAVVHDMDYNSTDDVLVLGTMGRGAWTLTGASAELYGGATALQAYGPFGWLTYQASFSGAVDSFGAVDDYPITLESGAVFSVVADQLAGLRAQISVVGPSGAALTTATSPAAGTAAYTAPVTVTAPGTYHLRITGVSNSTGAYRLRAIIGATFENELRNPSSINDSFFGSAENLNQVMREQGNPGAKLTGATVAGQVGAARTGGGFFAQTDSNDTYTFTGTAGRPVTVGLSAASGAGGLTLTVTAAGGPVAGAVTLTPTNFDRAVTFVPTATQTYTVQVASNSPGTATDYLLSVLTNGSMDAEGNDTAARAQTVPLTGDVRGAVGFGDEDWYKVTVPAGGPGLLYVVSTTPGDAPNAPVNALDPLVEVYDSTGLVLLSGGAATDNAAGDKRNSALAVSLSPNTTYLIRVRPSPLTATSTVGEYALQLTTDATNPGPVGVSAGGFYTGQAAAVEGQPLTLSASATDPNGDPLTYSWDLNGDGVFGDFVTQNGTDSVTWAQLVAAGVNDGPGTFDVQVRVSDGTNPAVTSLVTTLDVVNANPDAALYIGATGTATTATVDEGTTGVVVRLASPADPTAGPTDPSPVDVQAGLRYSYDLNGDGLFNDAGAGDGTYAGSAGVGASLTLPASAFADGSQAGTPLTINARVLDKDGGFKDVSVQFTVRNVSPTATGITGALSEGVNGTLAVAAASDPSVVDRTSLRYTFDLDVDNDGQYDWTITAAGAVPYNPAAAPTYADAVATATAPVPAALLPDGPATVAVRARVYDKDGGTFDVPATTLSVANTAPTGTVTNSGPVSEGSAAVVTVSSVFDPSATDTQAGFKYAYDFNDDGIFEVGADVTGVPSYAKGDLSNTASVPPSYLDDGNAAGTTGRTVRVRVYDKNDAYTEYTTTVGIANVPPTAVLTGAPVTVGSPLTVALVGQSDPSVADTQAGFKYSFDFNNNGTFTDPGDVLNSSSPTAAFTFQTPGDYTVHARIADKDGGFTDVFQTFTVANVQPSATLTFPPTVDEGGTATLAVSASHPSTATTAAGFRYAYDFDGDGVFDFPPGATGYATASPTSSVAIPPQYLADGPRQLSVRVRVYEVNGLSADFVAPIRVASVAPTATFTGPTGTVEVGDKVSFAFTGTADPAAADVAAGFRYSFDLNNDGDFTGPGEVLNSPTPTLTASFSGAGAKVVHGRVTDKDGASSDYFLNLTVKSKLKTVFAAGVDAGNAPAAQLRDAAGNVTLSSPVFDQSYTGGVRVATADVNGDGVPDVVAGTGPGVVAEVRVVDGATGRLLFSGNPFDKFTGGVFVAAGDMDGDGKAEFAISPDQGGGPRVVVYRGLGFLQTISFFGIDDPNFRGGARVGMADVNGDGKADLLVSAGFMGGPRVAGYDGAGLLVGKATHLFNDFFAFEPTLRNGVYLAGGDVNGDGKADLVIGAGPGGGPRVTVYDGASLLSNVISPVATFFTGNTGSRGGVRVAVADRDGDGLADVITGEADGPTVSIFLGKNLKTGVAGDETDLFPFSTPMNGVFVG